MSESFLPYGDSGSAGSGNSRKALLLAVAGVLVLALVGYFVVLPAFSGDDGTPETVALNVTRKKPNTPAKKAAPKPAASRKPTTTTTWNDTPVRDPFLPRYVPKVSAPSGGNPGFSAPGGQPVTQPTSPSTGGSTGGSSGGSSTYVQGQRVALIKVFSREGKTYAQTRVGSTVYTPAVGQTFAGSFQLLATSGTRATYLFGDEQFTLAEGQEVLK